MRVSEIEFTEALRLLAMWRALASGPQDPAYAAHVHKSTDLVLSKFAGDNKAHRFDSPANLERRASQQNMPEEAKTSTSKTPSLSAREK